MNLQDIFYVIAIIFMVLQIIILLAVAVTLYIIKKKISDFTNSLEDKFFLIKEIVGNPGQIAKGIGVMVANKALETVANIRKDKKKR